MGIPSNWRLSQQRYRLVGEECQKCGARIFPPRDVCPGCEAPAPTPQGVEEFVPYTVALIRLDEGPMVAAQLTDVDADELQVGMPVERAR